MSLVNRNKVNMESIVIHASKQRMEKSGETRKYQNYPNLGVGARGISNRNRIYSKTVCPTFNFTIPLSPSRVSFIASDSKSITLLISADDVHIFSYLVVLTPIGAGDTIQKLTTDKTVTFNNLDSDKYYNISVKSYNPAGYSAPYSTNYDAIHKYSSYYTTPYYTTIAAPENLSVIEATIASLTIQFTPPLLGDVSRYKVSYTSTYGTSTITNISETDLTTVDGYKRYTITGLNPGTLYTIKLYAIGYKGQSSAVTVTEDTLTQPIKSLDLTTINNSSIGIHYTAPDSASTIDMYRITYGVYGDSTTTFDVSNNVTSYILSELLSNTKYEVSVVTNDKNGDAAGNSTAVTKTQYTLPDSPRSITFSEITGSTALISFTEPSRNTNLTYYLEYYPTDTTTYDLSTNKSKISNFTTGTTISELLYPVNYTVKLKSINSVAHTSSSIIDSSFTTLDSTPSSIRHLTVSNVTTSSISISFVSPLKGSVTKFNIYWVTTAGNVTSSWNSADFTASLGNSITVNKGTVNAILNISSYSYTLSNLRDATSYYIRVTAENDKGTSDYSTFYSSYGNETTVKTEAIPVQSADIYVPKNFTYRLSQSVTL